MRRGSAAGVRDGDAHLERRGRFDLRGCGDGDRERSRGDRRGPERTRQRPVAGGSVDDEIESLAGESSRHDRLQGLIVYPADVGERNAAERRLEGVEEDVVPRTRLVYPVEVVNLRDGRRRAYADRRDFDSVLAQTPGVIRQKRFLDDLCQGTIPRERRRIDELVADLV